MMISPKIRPEKEEYTRSRAQSESKAQHLTIQSYLFPSKLNHNKNWSLKEDKNVCQGQIQKIFLQLSSRLSLRSLFFLCRGEAKPAVF
jgi:hypothetical protein